jgi:hypothetical protein
VFEDSCYDQDTLAAPLAAAAAGSAASFTCGSSSSSGISSLRSASVGGGLHNSLSLNLNRERELSTSLTAAAAAGLGRDSSVVRDASSAAAAAGELGDGDGVPGSDLDAAAQNARLRSKQDACPNTCVYVGFLGWWVTERDLVEYFQSYGELVSVRVSVRGWGEGVGGYVLAGLDG